MKFDKLGLNDQILESISYMNFENATPIQEKAIPEILKGKDMIACAQTGTGKTAAFILPILDKLVGKTEEYTDTLVIVPTRELATQIDQQIQGFAYFVNVSSLPLYGGGDGSNWDQQKKALTEGANIIVATPGKLISHLNLGYVKFDKVKHLILDEADRMLDMGFIDDIQKIISFLPQQRQNLLFSATMAPKIRDLASKILTDPVEINIAISKTAEGVLQAAYLTHNTQKNQLLTGLIEDKPDYKSIIIFSSTRKKVFNIVEALKKRGLNVEGISSDLEQKEREDALLRFRSKKTRIVVATDVLSRGIDIKDINLVINYDVPTNAEDYVHRVGRTARADTTGVALTFVNGDEMHKFHRIEKLIQKEVMKVPLPPELGEGPEWRVSSGGKSKKKYNKSGKGKPKGNYKKNPSK